MSLLIFSFFVLSNSNFNKLRVSGENIVDIWGNPIVLRGFHLWTEDWVYGFLDRTPYAPQWSINTFMTFSLDHLKQIKQWGFNVVSVSMWWTFHFEADENDVGNYDAFPEGYLLIPLLKTLIRMADDAGLYVILNIRVCMNSVEMPFWAGWSTHDYVVYNQMDSAGQHGLERFTGFLEWFVSELDPEPNVIGFNPWMFPFHNQDVPPGDERVNLYNTVVTPAMFKAIRKHSNKIIFWSPVHQGLAYVDGRMQGTRRYKNDLLHPIDDDVVYGIYGYGNDDIVIHTEVEAEVWDYNAEYLSSQFDYGRVYQERYNVPMYVVETGLNIHGEGTSERPIRQDRVDFYEELLSIYDEYPKNWMYYIYSGPGTEFGILDGEDSNNSDHESLMVSILKKEAPS